MSWRQWYWPCYRNTAPSYADLLVRQIESQIIYLVWVYCALAFKMIIHKKTCSFHNFLWYFNDAHCSVLGSGYTICPRWHLKQRLSFITGGNGLVAFRFRRLCQFTAGHALARVMDKGPKSRKMLSVVINAPLADNIEWMYLPYMYVTFISWPVTHTYPTFYS